MVRTGIQLQSFHGLSEPLPETIERIGETAIDGVELFDPDISSPTAIANAIEGSDLDVIGVHVTIDRLEREYQTVVETYEQMGCSRLIVPLYDPDAFASPESAEDAARDLSALAVTAADDGFDLLYHNHAFEFTQVATGATTAYESFVEASDPALEFELDTGLATYAGVDPVEILSRYGDRISLIHLTDSVPGREATMQVELGAGVLDIEACIECAREADVEWLIYEHGQTSDPMGSLTHAVTKLPRVSRRVDSGCESNSVTSSD